MIKQSKQEITIMKTSAVKTVLLLLILSLTNSVKSQTRIEKKYSDFGDLVQTTEYTKLGGNKEQVTIKDYINNRVSSSTIYFTVNGKIEGEYKEYSGSTLLQLFTYKDGKANGKYVRYHSNGKIETLGAYLNNQFDGVWKSYYFDGTIWKSGMYINGKEEGEWTYYQKNGKIDFKGSYVKGKKDGIWRTYFEDGSLESVKKFINGTEDKHFVSTEAVSNPCPNLKKLDNICISINNRTKDPKPKGDYYYMYQRKMLDAACVDVEKDSEEIIGEKIRKMWDAAFAQKKLNCHSIQFYPSGGNVLKFAVSTKFNEFIEDAIWWKVNLNFIDDVDKETVLDYVKNEIEKNKGFNIVSKLEYYYKILREAGAKHAAELKK